jgi:hypothetical protein
MPLVLVTQHCTDMMAHLVAYLYIHAYGVCMSLNNSVVHMLSSLLYQYNMTINRLSLFRVLGLDPEVKGSSD